MSAATYRLRVRLPDQPGALGRVATALGAVGADIDSIVVVERLAEHAVDDLVVSLPVTDLADRLVSACSSVPGVEVESVQRHQHRFRVADELALLDAAAASADPVRVVVDGVPDLLQVSYAMAYGLTAPVLSAGAPTAALRAGWAPPLDPGSVDAAALYEDPAVAGPDAELVAAPLGPGAALVAGRLGGPAFRPTETMRLTHLANLLVVATDDLRR